MRNDVQKDTLEKFPCGTAASGSHIAADVAKAKTAVWVESLSWEVLHAMGVAKKKKKRYTRMKKLTGDGETKDLKHSQTGAPWRPIC